ncbi:MAG: hypothetical protein GY772_19975 [bacterium]|nr:hypothetical protein [bacterium]
MRAAAGSAEDVVERVRRVCARVAGCARWVRIDDDALVKLAADLASADEPFPDPVHRPFGDEATTLAFVLTLDAVNFGSGWFPELRKRPGRSGYFSIATGLRERFEAAGPLPAAALVDTNSEDCAEMFGQRGAGEGAAELMELFARALRELGAWLLARYAGRFEGPVEAAGGSAARLVEALAEMPLYRDVSRYQGFEVPFFKRAQITASDLATAFGARGYGRFDDLRHLTIFADNLVPHVLRCEGVLVYATELAERVDAGELLPHGSPEEVEIRGLAVHAVERCVEQCWRLGAEATARHLDSVLWSRGQRPEMKARPRHRTRSSFY